MYRIAEGKRVIPARCLYGLAEDAEINTYARDICNHNILEVEAGTTLPRGEETKYGGVSYFAIKDAGGTNWNIEVTKDRHGHTDGLAVALAGTAELETMIIALKFITKVLEEELAEVHD